MSGGTLNSEAEREFQEILTKMNEGRFVLVTHSWGYNQGGDSMPFPLGLCAEVRFKGLRRLLTPTFKILEVSNTFSFGEYTKGDEIMRKIYKIALHTGVDFWKKLEAQQKKVFDARYFEACEYLGRLNADLDFRRRIKEDKGGNLYDRIKDFAERHST